LLKRLYFKINIYLNIKKINHFYFGVSFTAGFFGLQMWFHPEYAQIPFYAVYNTVLLIFISFCTYAMFDFNKNWKKSNMDKVLEQGEKAKGQWGR
jgi:hypothetical protein